MKSQPQHMSKDELFDIETLNAIWFIAKCISNKS